MKTSSISNGPADQKANLKMFQLPLQSKLTSNLNNYGKKGVHRRYEVNIFPVPSDQHNISKDPRPVGGSLEHL